MPSYEIYAIKYAGPSISSGAFMMWMKDWDLSVPRNSYFWCLTGGHGPILVDCGSAPQEAEKWNLANYREPDRALSALGIAPEEVEYVALTHLHWDHVGGLDYFPKARFLVHEDEYRFWLEDDIANEPPFMMLLGGNLREKLARLRHQGRLELVKGGGEILPGIEAVPAPGHTPGLMALSVPTARGRAVLASDCGHSFANLRENWPSSLIFDLPAWMASFKRVKQAADAPDLVFPGHDAAIAEDYPSVAEGVTRLA